MNFKRLLLALLFTPLFASAQPSLYTLHLNDVQHPVPSTLWGLFFEDINRSGDGGLYAELVKNRSFDFPDAFMGWTTNPPRHAYAKNDIFQIINQSMVNDHNPKYLQVTIANPGTYTLTNEGFGGVTVQKGETYEFSLRCRQQQPGLRFRVQILNAAGSAVASTDLSPLNAGREWTLLKATLTPTDSTATGALRLSFEGTGQMDIDRISLFPTNTWKGRSEGLRADLAQMLMNIQPGFMRFPGGCIVEGRDLSNRYQWKNTIGPLEARKLNANQWQDGAAGKPLPDYFQSYGLGFFEYFQLCEDLHAAPMPIINCGLSCQFGAGEVVPATEMDPYVQDALDLIEFANGDVGTKWGARRVALGHFEPFQMKYLGVGNENWGPQYLERLELFRKAIKAKYPDIQLVCATGYTPNPQFHYMDSALRAMQVDIIDEHYYQTVPWFLMNAGKYDHYDRSGPKIFIGEYACHSLRIGSPDNKNTQLCALAEAAFMTGIERNADIVTMAAYAPLFAHVKDWQWTPNLIWFNNSTSYATPSYYVQQLFSVNKGTDVVPITQDGKTISGIDSVWASAVIDKNKGEVIVKLVNPSASAKQKILSIPALKKATTGTLTVLEGPPTAVNDLRHTTVAPRSHPITLKGRRQTLDLPPYSFTVLKLKM